jgi:hypothetical protein
MKRINYAAGSNELREAYFKWRKEHPYIKASVMSFTAGYNAAKVAIEAQNKKVSKN